MLVVLGWLLGTAVLDSLLLEIVDDPVKWYRGARKAFYYLLGETVDPVAWIGYITTILMTSPFLVWAVQAIRRPWPILVIGGDDLAGLSPGLRDLVIYSRAVRVALESRDEATLREVWDWQRRFEQLGKGDRRELEHLGLGDPGIAELLHWTIAAPENAWRGMAELIGAFERFEQRLLDPTSPFRGPFR